MGLLTAIYKLVIKTFGDSAEPKRTLNRITNRITGELYLRMNIPHLPHDTMTSIQEVNSSVLFEFNEYDKLYKVISNHVRGFSNYDSWTTLSFKGNYRGNGDSSYSYNTIGTRCWSDGYISRETPVILEAIDEALKPYIEKEYYNSDVNVSVSITIFKN